MSDLIDELGSPSVAPSRRPIRPIQINQWRDPLGMLWRILQRSWLLILLGVLSLLLILSALFVPQLPAHLADNPAEVSRWMATARENFGFGTMIQTLGLFDVLHSTLLRFLLTLIGLTLAIHFADILATAIHLYRLPKRLMTSAAQEDGIVAIESPNALYNQRVSADHSLEIESESLQSRLADHFDDFLQSDLERDEDDANNEKRILARRHLRYAFLRPLLMLGLLLSLVPVWNITVYGWELSPDPLAPGDSLRYELKELEMRYEAAADGTSAEDDATTQFVVKIGEDEEVFQIDESLRTTIKQVEIRAATGPPALRISLPDGQEKLALPGQSTASSSVGLVFPGIGNEKFVLIPTHTMGLRIVRGQDDENQTYFLIEVLDQSDAEPIQREEIAEGESRIIEIIKGDTVLQIESLPGLAVSARYLPATWLLYPALALVLLGALGYWRRPGFVFAQLFSKDEHQSSVIYQSNSMNTLSIINNAAETVEEEAAE